MRVLVTGASGKTGRAITRALVARGASVRAAMRPGSPQESVCVAAGADEVAHVDLLGDALGAAVRGVDAVYHLAPNVHPAEAEMATAVADAAADAGVRRFAFHSVLHPEDASMPHHLRKYLAEKEVRAILPEATVIRPAAYLDNLLPAVRSGEIVVPYSLEAPFTNVALSDVADVAAIVVTEDGHAGRTYDLVGPESLSVREMARLASEVLGTPIPVRQSTIEDWSAGPGAGLSDQARDDLVVMFRAYDAAGLTGDSDDLPRLLGRPAMSWAEVLTREA